MAKTHDTICYKKFLLNFMTESEPLYAMQQWLTEKMMAVEAETKVSAAKGAHSIERTIHFSGTRFSRFERGGKRCTS